MPNIRDLAKHSGVSITTISRVLNGDRTGTSDATRERVMRAVRELNYVSLPTGPVARRIKTKTISTIVENLTERPLSNPANGYFAGVYEGILQETIEAGYSASVHAEKVWRDEQTAIRHTFDGRCDGVIFLAPMLNNEAVPALWERGMPLVIVGSPSDLPGVSTVDIENTESAAFGVKTLLAWGHKDIVYFGVGDTMFSSKERREGYRKGLLEAGAPRQKIRQYQTASITPSSSQARIEREGCQPETIEDGELSQNWLWVSELVDAALADGPIDAIICWNPAVSQATIAELQLREIRVPEDISVLGYDFRPVAPQGQPIVTAFSHPLYEIGKSAVHLLIERIEDPKASARHIRLLPDIVHGESVIKRSHDPDSFFAKRQL